MIHESSRAISLPHLFVPRDYQREPFIRLVNGCKKFFFVEHRRCGKDKKTHNLLVLASQMRTGLIFYIFPEATQGRKAVWKGRGSDGIKFLDHIPDDLKAGRPNNTEMSQELSNGSIIQILGASNIDSARGSNPVVIALSEYMLMSPYVLDTLTPILAENDGILILNGTPNGKGPAYKTFQYARSNPQEWCTTYLTVNDTKRHDGTPVIPLSVIEEYRRAGMSEEMIQQEYFCSWDSGSQGAYYTKQITQAEIDGRIGNFVVNRHLPILTFWDLGRADSTAIWWLQPDGDKLRMVYYYEAHSEGFLHYKNKLDEVAAMFGFKYMAHFGPHDLTHRQWGATLKSTQSIAREVGINFRMVPALGVQQGIDAVRFIFKDVWFHESFCSQGLESLRHYKKEYDDELRVFKEHPLHDWSSHAADAFRYFAVGYMENYIRPDMNQQRKFQNSFQS